MTTHVTAHAWWAQGVGSLFPPYRYWKLNYFRFWGKYLYLLRAISGLCALGHRYSLRISSMRGYLIETGVQWLVRHPGQQGPGFLLALPLSLRFSGGFRGSIAISPSPKLCIPSSTKLYFVVANNSWIGKWHNLFTNTWNNKNIFYKWRY